MFDRQEGVGGEQQLRPSLFHSISLAIRKLLFLNFGRAAPMGPIAGASMDTQSQNPGA